MPTNKNSKCVVNSFTLDGAVFEKYFSVTYENHQFKFKFTPKLVGSHEGKLYIEDDQKTYVYRIVICVRDVIEGELKIRTL